MIIQFVNVCCDALKDQSAGQITASQQQRAQRLIRGKCQNKSKMYVCHHPGFMFMVSLFSVVFFLVFSLSFMFSLFPVLFWRFTPHVSRLVLLPAFVCFPASSDRLPRPDVFHLFPISLPSPVPRCLPAVLLYLVSVLSPPFILTVSVPCWSPSVFLHTSLFGFCGFWFCFTSACSFSFVTCLFFNLLVLALFH